MAQKTQAKVVNGVNVDELFKTVDAIKATPGIAKFKFRIANEWVDGGYNRSTCKDFHGAHEDIQHATTFVLEADEPAILLGKDRGANPVEHLLHAVASCVTSAMVYHAAARGIRIDEVESTVHGNIDLRGFLGIDPNVRRGYQDIRMDFRVKADVTDEQLRELVELGPTFSPVFDSVTKGVPITVNAGRM
jgi:uncharacterized OsmC-like protein